MFSATIEDRLPESASGVLNANAEVLVMQAVTPTSRLFLAVLACIVIACGGAVKVEGPSKPFELDIKTDPLAYHKLLSMYEEERDEAERLRLKGELNRAEEMGPRVEYECHNWVGGGSLEVYLIGGSEREVLLVSTSCGHEGVGTSGTFRFAKQLTGPGRWRIRVKSTNQPWYWMYSFRVYVGGEDVCTYKAEARKEGALDIISGPRHPKCDFAAK